MNGLTQDARAGKAPSAREIEVLRGIWDGLSFKEIGHKLEISEMTIRQHSHSLHVKTGCHNQIELVRWGLRNKLLTI